MSNNRPGTKYLVLAALICAMAVVGCGKKITISRYPAFYNTSLKTVAIVPFRNSSGVQEAGLTISDSLATAMMANGTYKVYNRNDLKTLMDERDLQVAMGSDTAAAAAKFRKLGTVQAILTGTVTTYATTTRSEHRREPRYAYDNNGNPIFMGYNEYDLTTNEANVVVTAALISVADGSTIAATSVPAQGAVSVTGSPPPMDPFRCLVEATNQAVFQLVSEFAVTRRLIKVDPGKDLRTASELYDNKWEYADRFLTGDDKMYVVVQLPADADRNNFRITIVRKDERTDLAAQDIVWSSKYKTFGYLFNPSEIAKKGDGAGTYTIKFYSGPEPAMTRDFQIVEGTPKKRK